MCNISKIFWFLLYDDSRIIPCFYDFCVIVYTETDYTVFDSGVWLIKFFKISKSSALFVLMLLIYQSLFHSEGSY